MAQPIYIGERQDGTRGLDPQTVKKATWPLPAGDKKIIQELGKQYAEIAADPRNAERKQRIIDNNSLRPRRPAIWIDELPWHEMNYEHNLDLRCESEEGKSLEQFFRRILFRWKYFPVDMVVEDTLWIMKAYTHSGIGVDVQEDVAVTDSANDVISHHYKDELETPEQVEKLAVPKIQSFPEIDRENLEYMQELFSGIVPVGLRGYAAYCTAWDTLGMLRGVTPCINDIIDRPEHIHAIMKKMAELENGVYEQMQAQGLLDVNIKQIHTTPAFIDDSPAKDYSGGNYRYKDVWYRAAAQPLDVVSPAMREEFDIDYFRPLMEKFDYVYYGCCERLNKCIDLLRTIPNMRKIGCSPWADVPSLIEQVGGDYVVAFKSNPASVGIKTEPEQVQKEIGTAAELCLKYKAPWEILLKDISTVGYKPENLFIWAKVAEETLDKYY
jgi:hypothetical protein